MVFLWIIQVHDFVNSKHLDVDAHLARLELNELVHISCIRDKKLPRYSCTVICENDSWELCTSKIVYLPRFLCTPTPTKSTLPSGMHHDEGNIWPINNKFLLHIEIEVVDRTHPHAVPDSCNTLTKALGILKSSTRINSGATKSPKP